MKFKWKTRILFVFLIIFSCTSSTAPGPKNVVINDGKINIEDRTGKRWDVTHAVEKYGFKAEDFEFGLGPFAIQPIQNPKFIKAGDAGFPSEKDRFLVIGTDLNNDPRAYPISVLSRHEITNEQFNQTHVAVGY